MRRLILTLLVLVFVIVPVLLFSFRITAIADFRLQPWHTFVPRELSVDAIDKARWPEYLEAERALLEEVQREMREHLSVDQQYAYNRFDENSRVFPGHLSHDWNRSYIAEPAQPAKGAVVLLHGLTDSPYSLRHLAAHFQAKGYVAVAIRMPGHGSVPAGLTAAYWQDWMAATRLAVREAMRRTPDDTPLVIVGFSNGGALAVKYALDALENPALTKPAQLVLISPMIGVSPYARFAGIAGLPALFPAFANAAWLSVLPEFNPFKYNSFPVNAARQSYELTQAVRQQLIAVAGQPERLAALPPILTFQSLVDGTVSTQAIASELYDRLPANGSELIIFDTNDSLGISEMLQPSVGVLRERLMTPTPRNYTRTLIAVRGPGDARLRSITLAQQASVPQEHPIEARYPAGLISLSHVALPFPLDDALYGQQPTPLENYGLNLGALNMKGEHGALIMDAGSFSRATSNPFFELTLNVLDRALGLQRDDAPESSRNHQ